jgi:hypothetical protein
VHICAFCLGFCPAVHRPARAHGFRFRAAPRAVPLCTRFASIRGDLPRPPVSSPGRVLRCAVRHVAFRLRIGDQDSDPVLRSRTGRGPQAITAHAPRARWPLSADYALMVRRG